MEEPHGINPLFRLPTDRKEVSTKQWADGYLSAFQPLRNPACTFDRALARKAKGAVLLG
jgi:hypothetical protein